MESRVSIVVAIKLGNIRPPVFDFEGLVSFGVLVQGAVLPRNPIIETRPGTVMPVIVGALGEVFGELPLDANVSLLSDFSALPDAWAKGWLQRWRAETFSGTKPAHPDAWRKLDEIIGGRRLTVSGRRPGSPTDKELLKTLRADIERGRPLDPGEPEDSAGGYVDNDAARRRAMERDRDPF